MSEKELLIKEKVDHTGLFNFAAIYKFAHAWLIEEDHGVIEEEYSEKVEGNKRRLDIKWFATRRLSDYFKSQLKIKFEVTDMTDVEVELEGKKKKMNKGKIKIEIKGTIITDHESKWETSPFARFMRDTYNKYVIPSRIEDIKDYVKDTTRDFKDELKAYLEMSGSREQMYR